ncbi:unnamed protein product [Ixodes persulcatus]
MGRARVRLRFLSNDSLALRQMPLTPSSGSSDDAPSAASASPTSRRPVIGGALLLLFHLFMPMCPDVRRKTGDLPGALVSAKSPASWTSRRRSGSRVVSPINNLAFVAEQIEYLDACRNELRSKRQDRRGREATVSRRHAETARRSIDRSSGN